MPKISKVKAREILDSRGDPTLEVSLTAEFTGKASIPSGASKGKYEAVELRDDGERYGGKGVLKAVKNVNRVIGPKLCGLDVREQETIDKVLLDLDGTPNKSQLGANALLGCSLACARTASLALDIPLYKYLNRQASLLPLPLLNIINGGAHAGTVLDVQEFMIIPYAKSFSESLQDASEIYHALGGIIEKKYGANATNVGDEGGYAPPVENPEDAITLIQEAIDATGHKKTKLALDVAANERYKDGKYHVGGKIYSVKALVQYYTRLVETYPIVSIEDPFSEDDWDGFCMLTEEKKGLQVVGDDMYATNRERLEQGAKVGAGNAIILKPNQIGTLTEALEVARYAKSRKFRVIVSHRSGETCDPFIADLAVALGCGQIKTGAPCRGERVAKYNRLLEIESDLGSKAEFPKRI